MRNVQPLTFTKCMRTCVKLEMDMDASFVLFTTTKTVTLREEDMKVENISKIFQVTCQSLYLTDHNNVAVFPREDGHFSSLDLRDQAHYGVHGSGASPNASVVNVPALGPPPAPSSSSQFRFARSASSASTSVHPRAQSLKYLTRTVNLGELQSGKLVNSRMVVVRFTEQEATVPSIIAQVKEALGSNAQLILTDHNGVEMMDSEGTRGSFYWKQNSRKIMAVPEGDFQAMQQKKRRISRLRPLEVTFVGCMCHTFYFREASIAFQDAEMMRVDWTVYSKKIEEVVLAAQGLTEVTSTIQELSNIVHQNRKTTLALTEEQSRNVRAAFTCLVCREFMEDPVYAACCESLVGCRSCTTLWQQNSPQCLKCREDDFSSKTHRVTGLSEIINVVKELAQRD